MSAAGDVMGRAPSPAGRLAAAGGGLLLAALPYLAVAYLPRHAGTPHWHLGRAGDWHLVGAGFALGLAGAFGCYLAAWRAARRLAPTPARVALVAGVAALASLLLLPTYPLLSDDLFYSVFTGRILAHYHRNPYLLPPASFPGDPWLRYAGWTHLTSPYGPLWTAVSAGASLAAGERLAAQVLAFKGLAVAAFLLATALLARLLARRHPAQLLPGLVLWAWNPLVLLESAGNGHNGFLMVALLLLALVLAVEARPAWAFAALALALAVKYAALVALPLLAVYVARGRPGWRARARALLPALLAATGVLVALFAPCWVGWRTLGVLGEAQHYYGSPTALARLALAGAPPALRDWLPRALLLLAGALAAPRLLRAAGRDAAGLLRACYAALLLTLAAWPFFMPWYAAWVVPLAAALGQTEEAYQVVAFSAAAAASYLCQYSLRQASPHSVWFWSAASALAVFGALALAILGPCLPRARPAGDGRLPAGYAGPLADGGDDAVLLGGREFGEEG